MPALHRILALAAFAPLVLSASCPHYSSYSTTKHEPYSEGKYKLPYQRPTPECRTFSSPVIEETIARIKSQIADPDLGRLFENTFPNTLDTMIAWQGLANNTDEELTFVITGDINAMWLRDSANQMQPYAPLLSPLGNDTLSALFRGVINLHARYILIDAYCNAFQAPVEANLAPNLNTVDKVFPSYDFKLVYQCSWQLDSLAAFLQISVDYWKATKDVNFFMKYDWVAAVENVLKTVEAMRVPTYAMDGAVNPPPYTFFYCTGHLANGGYGSPVNHGTGLIRSSFRPSDDPTIYQFFIPANMMFQSYLSQAAQIMAHLNSSLAYRMSALSTELHAAIETHGVLYHPVWGRMYAYEVDGFGSVSIMDDANTPSLLSAPMSGYLDKNNEIYQNTRKMVLGPGNPYWSGGPVLSSVGGPHIGLGMGWPMASIVRIMTTDNDTEITETLQALLSSTDGLGLMHESVNAFDQKRWTRQWFGWANGLFGQMIMDLAVRKPEILQKSFQ